MPAKSATVNRKSELLGMPFGTAAGRLRKNVLYQLVCALNLNYCFRCGAEIDTERGLSIEHKEPWQSAENPIEMFFDLDNIAFSHLGCNSSAARQPNKKYKNAKERESARKKRWWAKKTPEERKAHRRARYEKYGN